MLRGWTEDPYESRLRDQAHPRTSDAFDDFLRHRSAEAIAIYTIRHRPWWQRVNWARIAVWTTLVGVLTASWTVVALGIAVLAGAI